jgi:predicted nucleic acid-binding protein
MPNEQDTSAVNKAQDVVLDTCCLVNLAAIDGTLECLAKFGLIWYVPTAVQAEGIFIRVGRDSRQVNRIDLARAVSTGTVQICALTGEEEHGLYVEFALSLDDGEAMALAIAKNRNWRLATDDRKARLKAKSVGVAILTTPELVKRWVTKTGHSEAQIADALRRIETLARFAPADDSDAARWWRKVVAENPSV